MKPLEKLALFVGGELDNAQMMSSLGVKVPAVGPVPAKIMIVGEAPGKHEVARTLEDGTPAPAPFVGESGLLLSQMLQECGIDRSSCFVTNVCRYRPPKNDIEEWKDERKTQPSGFDRSFCGNYWVHPAIGEGIGELEAEINRVQPTLIIALGNTALWALTGLSGIAKWRGSVLASRPIGGRQWKVLPTFHPAAIMRQWDQRWIACHDLRRARLESEDITIRRREYRFDISPSFQSACDRLRWLLQRADEHRAGGGYLRLAGDVETRGGTVDCIGIAWSSRESITIPLRTIASGCNGSYFTAEEEVQVLLLIRALLCHPAVKCCWQGGSYDLQYIAKEWGFIPSWAQDTMTMQWTMLPGTQKSLEFIGSLFAEDYVYWKDDGRKWNPKTEPESKRWFYNSEDCVYTWECGWEKMPPVIEARKYKRTKHGTPLEIQYRMQEHMLRAMLRGVKFDSRAAAKMLFDLQEARGKCESYINTVIGKETNTNSPQQLQAFFYDQLGLKPVINYSTKRPTTDADALIAIGKREPLLRPLCSMINWVREIRNSQGVILQPKDADGRLRCSYNINGTETFRFSSSEDAFGFGGNLQNISAGTPEADIGKAYVVLPNLRKLLIPDEGFEWGDFDLPQADARVVAWDADDEELMQMFLDPSVDLHTENAKAIFGNHVTKDSVLQGKMTHRYAAKKGVHATNYLVTAKVLAEHLGITVHEADRFINRWLDAHPKIRRWHERIIRELQTRRYIENAYGYRRYYFDRIEGIVKEAVAWIPQSTTAITINLGIDQVCRDEELKKEGVALLLQVHDSADFQWPISRAGRLRDLVTKKMTVEVPYPKPLIMPPGLKVSTKSWGDCKELKK